MQKTNSSEIKQILKNNLWHNNPAIVQLLGLCPLLAVSNNLVNALTLGIATIIVLVLSNLIISSIKNYLDKSIRIPYFMLIIASIVTIIILFMQAYNYSLYKTLGVYLALITTNCVILARIEAFAYKNNIIKSTIDGLFTGLGFSLVLILLGAIREIIGQGTLFSNCNLLFGDIAINWTININNYFNFNNSFILAILPPGAFLLLGFIIALKNYINIYNSKKSKNIIHEQTATLSAIPKISTK